MWRLAIPAALAFGEFCGFASSTIGSAWPLAAFLFLLTASVGYGRAIRGWGLAAVFLAGFALALHSSDVRRRTLRDAAEPGRPLEASLIVEGVPAEGVGRSGWTSFDATYKGVDVRVVLHLDDGVEPPLVGETWRCAGWLERRPADDFRRRRVWIKGRGTFAVRETCGGRSGMRAFFDSARRGVSRRMGIGLEGTGYSAFADVNRAMILGERSRLPHDVRETFVDSGTLHMFAISGLHVAIVAKIFIITLVVLFVPYRFTGVVAVPLLWFYVGMVGAGPSAVRAAAMATICMLAPLWLRRPDGISAWAATFVVFHLVWPESIMSVASRLSFTVMLGILLFVEWARSFRSRSIEIVGFTVAAWAAGAPIVAHMFGRLTPGGIVANFLLVPAAGCLVCAAVLGVAASFVSTALAAHLNYAAALFAKAMVGVSWAVSRLPFASVKTEPWTFWDCAAWYAVLGLSMWLVRSIAVRRRQTF